MLSNCLVNIEKEVARHITLANSLKERNEALSSKIVDLEFKLNEKVGELLAERQTVAKTNQSAEKWRNRCEKLEKDMTLMKQTAEDIKNSATVSNFLSSLAINLENMTLLEKSTSQKSLQRVPKGTDTHIKELEKELENLEKTNSFLIQTAMQQASYNEELRANAIKNCSQCSRNVEEVKSMRMANQLLENDLGQCTEEIEGLKNTIARKEKEIDAKKCDIDRFGEQQAEIMATEKEKNTTRTPIATEDASKKNCIVVRRDNWNLDVWKDTVECIEIKNTINLSNLSKNVSFHHNEMFILVEDRKFYRKESYANLLRICQSFKKLRPNGEIHVIAWRWTSSGSIACPAELKSLFTTFNTFESHPEYFSASFAKAIRKHWPKYADQLQPLPQLI